MNKRELFGAVIRQLEAEIAASAELLGSTHDTINDSPGAMQSHSDTTRFQTSLVANQQTCSLGERRQALCQLQFFLASRTVQLDEEIGLGSVVSLVDDEDDVSNLILLPAGGALNVTFDGLEYMVMTPASPLAKVLMGKRLGDAAEYKGGRGNVAFKITQVS